MSTVRGISELLLRWRELRQQGQTCSAEDLVIHKVFAGRDRDWSDVESVLVRQHGILDLQHIRAELVPLLEIKEDSESFAKLERMIAKVDSRLGD